MSYSTMTHALISYVEGHLGDLDLKKMSDSFGFSEVYLRELFVKNVKKIFGMSPSQFRRKRSLIGRKQLDTGVFGLEWLTRKEKRSETNLKQDNENTILYGIRKIQ